MKNIILYKNIFIAFVNNFASKPTGTIWTILTFASVFFGSGYIGSVTLRIANLEATIVELKSSNKAKDSIIENNMNRELIRLNATEKKYEELRDKANELNKKVKK